MLSPVITLDGLVLNSLDGTSPQWIVDTLDGWYGSPKPRNAFSARPYAAGSYYSPAYADARTVTINGTVVTDSPAALIAAQRRLVGLCNDPVALCQLRVDDFSGTLSAMVQRSAEVLLKPVNPVAAAFSLSLTAPDPRLFGPVRTVSTPMAQSSGAGIPWRGASGTSGIQWRGSDGLSGILWRGTGTVITSGVVLLDNTDGTAPADVVITLRGPAQNPSVSTSTRWLTYNGNLGTNDVLVIDTGSGSVLLNGVNRRPYLTKAQFFQVPAASSLDVRFTAEVQNATAQMTCTWQPSYA